MKRQIQIWGGVALAAAILYYMFRDTDWAEVGAVLGSANPLWLAATIGTIVLSFATRVQRWTYIVRTAKPLPYRPLYSATQIGFLANFTLPGRVGEVIRAYVLARLGGLPFPKCMAMVAVDRITDLFGLVTMLLITVAAFRPEGDIVLPAELGGLRISPAMVRAALISTAGGAAGLVAAFVLLYAAQDWVVRVVRRLLGGGAFAERVAGMTEHFAQGLHIFRSGGELAKALAWSLITWGVCGLSFLTCMWAFGLEPPWYSFAIVLALLSVVISLPGAPGFVGQFQLGIMAPVFVVLPDTPVDTLRALGIAAHLLNLVPIVAIGLWCVYRENLGLLELRRETEAVEHAAE